jgi:hypothetical protein
MIKEPGLAMVFLPVDVELQVEKLEKPVNEKLF